jgi:histidyl-tRNA synthetase
MFPPMQTKPLPGFRDFYPADLALRAHIFRTWRRVAARYGFEEYDGPPLEPLELYTAKSGDEIVGQLYNFVDKGERGVALRPEMTPTLARMVAAQANGLKKPIRWFSIPQLFRYERQQRGRLREHFQLNCDLIGDAGPWSDAEIIALAIDIMRELGFTAADVRVRLSDRRLLGEILGSLGLEGPHEALAHQALDKIGRAEYGPRKQALLDAGVSQGIIDRLEALRDLRDLDAIRRWFPSVQTGPVAAVLEGLGAMNLAEFVDIDLTIVRGLAYYTGTVFELFDAKKSLRAICGGGRYDDLLKSIGGVDLPALGFGMGDVVLGELLREHGMVKEHGATIDVFVAGVTEDDLADVRRLTHELRDANLRVEYPFGASSLRKQLALADARRAQFAVVIGPDDRARGEVMIKDLGGKSQESVARGSAVDYVKSRVPAIEC